MPIPAAEASHPGGYVHVAYPQEYAQIIEWAGRARRYMKVYGVESLTVLRSLLVRRARR